MQKPGLVISYFGNSVAVEDEAGQVFPCHLHRNQELPVVGDKVSWALEASGIGSIVHIEPRRSVLAKDDGRGKKKILAANIDALVIVMAPKPYFSEYLLDRYIIAAELLHIDPILVVNKMDLLDERGRQAEFERLKAYRDIPYTLIFSSKILKDGLSELKKTLKNKNAVLVGPSGVGKSSIIQALSNNEVIKTAEVSPKGIGKHTTTVSRLYHLKNGGSLIDSPGVRDFNLWPVCPEEIRLGFKEFQPYLTGCKFRDCSHTVEPGCQVQVGIQNGKISPQRFASYLELMKEARITRS